MVACQPSKAANGPGLHAPARLVLALLLASGLVGVPPSQAQPSQVPVPDSLELNKLVWSTMAAIDHANLAGNYSVLRDLSAPNFQILNDSAKLASIFASLRASGIDLSNALLLAPTFSAPQATNSLRDPTCPPISPRSSPDVHRLPLHQRLRPSHPRRRPSRSGTEPALTLESDDPGLNRSPSSVIPAQAGIHKHPNVEGYGFPPVRE